MEDQELRQRLDALGKRIGDVYASAERSRKYILAIIVVSVVAFVLPLIGLLFAVPSFISTFGQLGGF